MGTQTEYQTQYETQYETQFTPQYVTVTSSYVDTQTYCPPEPQQGYELPQVSYGGGLSNLNSYSPPAASFVETSNFQVSSSPGILEFHGIGALDGGSTYLQKRQAKVEEAPSIVAKEETTEVDTEEKSEVVDTAR